MPRLYKIVDDTVTDMNFHPIDVKDAKKDGWMTVEEMSALSGAVKKADEAEKVEADKAAPKPAAGAKPTIAGAKPKE